MIGNLTTNEIGDLLYKEVVGRIGCYANGRMYVVPVSYAYDGNDIYIHTYEGLKMKMMRENPNVCFEIDDFRDMGKWQSVIAWGQFEEIISEEERKKALRLLINRSLPVISSVTTHLGSNWPFSSDELEEIDGIVFRIKLHERTGKFETSSDSPGING